jgi:hypothetical protein
MGSEVPTTTSCDFSAVWEAANDHGQGPSATFAAFASGELQNRYSNR